MSKRLAVGFLAVLVLSGCGGASNEASETELSKASASAAKAGASAAAAASASAEARASASIAAQEAATRDFRTCSATFGQVYTNLVVLDSRVNVGLTQAEYKTMLGDARASYGAATQSFDGLSVDCLKAGHQLELALNRYLGARPHWGNCVQDYCTPRETGLHGIWAPAHNCLERYSAQLGALIP